ncbi:hypothetical protein Msil_1309 [Methylocella silvestris BL2]|uniref:Uncharacterized protein n=1 Tax=Methylocella silvestris (strain DSM 15510 / CIP 108128 / LMG 27833 / NCIMB 13906 / BL2) TaxID=395965 RepID=B8ER90_METSB|nr:hypothetical protein Msil_1309 [Methylocella silvestris BL2]
MLYHLRAPPRGRQRFNCLQMFKTRRLQDPFSSALMARGAAQRLLAAGAVIALLWIAIFWAVSLP